MLKPKITLFDTTIPQHQTAAELFNHMVDVPLICPHTHVDPRLFSNPDAKFGDPASIFVTSDHYVLRMLVSHGIPFEDLGVSTTSAADQASNPRAVWKLFCEHFDLFDGTPSGLWIENTLSMVFGLNEKPGAQNADRLFDQLQAALDSPSYHPRKLYRQFNIEVLCTTDSAADRLEAHLALRQSGWEAQVYPTFRPDAVVQIGHSGWTDRIVDLGGVVGREIGNYRAYIHALEDRRLYFKSLGTLASDHASEKAFTCRLTNVQAEKLFQKGLAQTLTKDEVWQFTGHMIVEMARMSVEDGMVMQFHVGAHRNHNPHVFDNYGPDMGFDMPLQAEWTNNLKPLLETFGMDGSLQLILFTLDEGSYARELAPLAGAYPAIKIGPPWWFYDSPEGMMRYFNNVMETAGIDNTVGFNDDARNFLTLPARHDLWRRMSALWLAKLVHRGQINLDTAQQRMIDLAYGLAKKGYRLPSLIG